MPITTALDRIEAAMALVTADRFPAGPLNRRIGVWQPRTKAHLVSSGWTVCGRRKAPTSTRMTFRRAFSDIPLCAHCAEKLWELHNRAGANYPIAVVAKWLEQAGRAQRAWDAYDAAETMPELRAALNLVGKLSSAPVLEGIFGADVAAQIRAVGDDLTARIDARLAEVGADPTPVRTTWATAAAVALAVEAILCADLAEGRVALAAMAQWLTPTTSPTDNPAMWLAVELARTAERVANGLVAARRAAIEGLVADDRPTLVVVIARPSVLSGATDVGAAVHDIVERRQACQVPDAHLSVCVVDRLEAAWLASARQRAQLPAFDLGAYDGDSCRLQALAGLARQLRAPALAGGKPAVAAFADKLAAAWEQAGAVAA